MQSFYIINIYKKHLYFGPERLRKEVEASIIKLWTKYLLMPEALF